MTPELRGAEPPLPWHPFFPSAITSLMPKKKVAKKKVVKKTKKKTAKKAAQRKLPGMVSFVAPAGSKKFYREAAALEGIRIDAWMRSILHAAAIEVFEAHGRDTRDVPDAHIPRPPRLQPRFGFEDEGDDDDKGDP